MRASGILLIILGPLLTLVAFSMDTSVYSYGGDVNNLGLMQKQMMVLHTGLSAFIAGAVLLVGSSFPQSGTNSVAGPVTAARAEESYEDREERSAGVRRLNRIIGFSLIIALLFLVILIAAGSTL